MPACQQLAALCSQQGRACAAMQLLAAMQLRGPGPDPGSKQLVSELSLNHQLTKTHWCSTLALKAMVSKERDLKKASG